MSGSTRFFLKKMSHCGAPELQYALEEVPLNPVVGAEVELVHTGLKQCVACGRPVKKTIGEGYCFPCNQKLARCDLCIVRPERCHYHKGTCREPEWGEKHCLIPHVIYLANTSGLKIGITRLHKRFERWGDQGASAAIPLVMVSERLHAGEIESRFAKRLADKTDWRALITGREVPVDLEAEARALTAELLQDERCSLLPDEVEVGVQSFEYPILRFPERALTWNFDKTPRVAGRLDGIKGQYLFIGGRALNIRKFSGYEVEVTLASSNPVTS